MIYFAVEPDASLQLGQEYVIMQQFTAKQFTGQPSALLPEINNPADTLLKGLMSCQPQI